MQGDGESVGVPAEGELEGSSFNPLGNPGMKHWQASYIDHGWFEDRGNIFFAAVEMTRMPMAGYMDELPEARAQPLDILSKPYRQEELLARVRAILPAVMPRRSGVRPAC